MPDQEQQTDAASQAEEIDGIGKVDFDSGAEEPEEVVQEASAPDQSQEKETEALKEEGESFINQEAVNKRINEITFQKYEEKRKREQLEEELNQLKAKIEKQNTSSDDVQIPDLPDVYDDDYEEKIRAREAALKKAAELNARKTFLKEQEQQVLQEKMKRQQDEVMKQVNNMYSSAKKLGISEEELKSADATVSNFIKDPSIARFILAQDDAALIVKYLSSSAQELESLSSMDPLHASVRIATKIASEAKKLKPSSITQTPDPIEIPKGKATLKDDPYLEGAKFE